MPSPAAIRRLDLRSVAITGLATVAWYAVPDVVGPRWARALVKAGVLAGGVGLGIATTAEGRSAVEGAREVRDELRDLREADGREEPHGERDDNVLVADGVLDGADTLPQPLLLGVSAGALALGVAVAVAGEKWAYRRGERWRERGLRLPHTRVGLVLGVLAAAATALDPTAAREVDEADEAGRTGEEGAAVR